MRRVLFLIHLLLLSGCDRHAPAEVVVPKVAREPEIQLEFPDHFDSAWVMSSGWLGYMGVAIAISGDRYYYWMYSDAGSSGRDDPYVGTFRIEGDLLLLGEPSRLSTESRKPLSDNPYDPPEELSLYGSSWRIIRTPFGTKLHHTGDREKDAARSLIQDFHFDPNKPFRNQMFLKPG